MRSTVSSSLTENGLERSVILILDNTYAPSPIPVHQWPGVPGVVIRRPSASTKQTLRRAQDPQFDNHYSTRNIQTNMAPFNCDNIVPRDSDYVLSEPPRLRYPYEDPPGIREAPLR